MESEAAAAARRSPPPAIRVSTQSICRGGAANSLFLNLAFSLYRRAPCGEVGTLHCNRDVLGRNQRLWPRVGDLVLALEVLRNLLHLVGKRGRDQERIPASATVFRGPVEDDGSIVFLVDWPADDEDVNGRPGFLYRLQDLLVVAIAQLRAFRRQRDDNG